MHGKVNWRVVRKQRLRFEHKLASRKVLHKHRLRQQRTPMFVARVHGKQPHVSRVRARAVHGLHQCGDGITGGNQQL